MFCTSSQAAQYRATAYSAACKEFGDGQKATVAADSVACGIDFLNHIPIGWNVNDSQDKLAEMCKAHIKANIKPKGFIIPAIVFTWFFEAVFSWAVQKVLEIWWEKHHPAH